jgi:dTDP-glucose 4,6-dehydratase
MSVFVTGGAGFVGSHYVRTGVQRVVHISTDEVYGSAEKGSWTEACPLAPNSPYAASKAASDLVARSNVRTHGLIPAFTTRLLRQEPVPLYGDGSHTRERVHVGDHCDGVYRAHPERRRHHPPRRPADADRARPRAGRRIRQQQDEVR